MRCTAEVAVSLVIRGSAAHRGKHSDMCGSRRPREHDKQEVETGYAHDDMLLSSCQVCAGKAASATVIVCCCTLCYQNQGAQHELTLEGGGRGLPPLALSVVQLEDGLPV
jgi:hypothetical protein